MKKLLKAAFLAVVMISTSAGATTEQFSLQNVSITDTNLHETVNISGTFTVDLAAKTIVSGNIVSTIPNDPCLTGAVCSATIYDPCLTTSCLPPVFDSAAGAVFSNNGSVALDQMTARVGTPSSATWAPYDAFGMQWFSLNTAPGGVTQIFDVGVGFWVPNATHTGYKSYSVFANVGGSNTFTGTILAVPEPSSWVMLLAGLVVLSMATWRNKRRNLEPAV
jgi:hypothetical protein